jgi:hypothetical protein
MGFEFDLLTRDQQSEERVNALAPTVYHEIYRRAVREEGLDPSLPMGHILDRLMYDDGNLLTALQGAAFDPAFTYDPTEGRASLESIRARMQWEKEAEETPVEVKKIIEETIPALVADAVPTYAEWKLLADSWWKMKARVQEQFIERPDWQKAREVYRANMNRLHQKYRDPIMQGRAQLSDNAA